jgi:hypothetical protein
MSAPDAAEPQYVVLQDDPQTDGTASDDIFSPFDSSKHSSITLAAEYRPKKRRESFLDTESSAQQAAPFLAKHIPTAYSTERFGQSASMTSMTRTYCNRHNPNAKCWRQTDEPTMEELQKVRIVKFSKSSLT